MTDKIVFVRGRDNYIFSTDLCESDMTNVPTPSVPEMPIASAKEQIHPARCKLEQSIGAPL